MTDIMPRIVFMGTPEFAVASLQSLTESGFSVEAVVTAPDKPAGRGQKLTQSAVKQYALRNNLRVLQPVKLKDPGFLHTLKSFNADIFVVVAFRMLPEEVWRIPALGTFNLHASLLPEYRGAAPVNHVLMNGETKTGVTTFMIDNQIDTGNVLLSHATEIGTDETAGDLHDRLMNMGAALVVETAKGLAAGTIRPVPQVIPAGSVLHSAPRIFPADTVINWNETAEKVHNKIRGLSPFPGAVTQCHTNKRAMKIKLYESRIAGNLNSEPGSAIVSDRSRLFISCRQGSVEILSLQAEGRKRMTTAEFLRGYDLSECRFE